MIGTVNPFLQKLGGLFGGTQEGLFGPEETQRLNNQGLMNFGMSMLANSGYSPQKQSFGQILGNSMLQSQQANAQAQEWQLRNMLIQKQLTQKQKKNLVPVVGPDGKPIYQDEQEAEGMTPWMKSGSEYGAYQPGDYTPQSWAKFITSKDPSVLERYSTPRQEYSPSFQNVTRTLPDGSTQQGTFNTRSGEYNWAGSVVPPGKKAGVDAQAKAEGEAAGAQKSKAPAAASMEYVMSEFDKQIDSTMQGGVFGVAGKAGEVVDYEDATRFDNLREQLSTELRTVYRIPGEGTLSDREQQQYGIQLPNRNNTKRVNKAIIEDLRERTKLRLETPIDNNGPPKPTASPKKESAADRAKRLGL